MREFLVALNASFTNIIEKGLNSSRADFGLLDETCYDTFSTQIWISRNSAKPLWTMLYVKFACSLVWVRIILTGGLLFADLQNKRWLFSRFLAQSERSRFKQFQFARASIVPLNRYQKYTDLLLFVFGYQLEQLFRCFSRA